MSEAVAETVQVEESVQPVAEIIPFQRVARDEVEAVPDEPSESTLLAGSKQGDINAFGELFARHRPTLIYFAVQLGVASPEDVVGDVFLRSFEKLDRFEDRGWGIRPWLFRITQNLAYDQHKSFHNRRCQVSSDAEIARAMPPVEDFAERFVQDDRVARLLSRLPEIHRHAVQAVFIEGATNREYSQSEGIAYPTVGTRLIRARETLRAILAKEAAFEEAGSPASQPAEQNGQE